eukprot:TRINITY_DN38971_c0_g2_i1.p1 TRINITY_DN38971_c0_g2~~TRINITY_DN38971_c0_g2_i1.p1  ORF type:complete len:160 (-),score=30.54 TRINITY_DN38971_c0_g2_i1:78-557(-)
MIIVRPQCGLAQVLLLFLCIVLYIVLLVTSGLAGAMDKKKAEENSYIIHPEYKNKFRPGPTREIIKDVLTSKLEKATYNMETTQLLTRQLSDEIKDRLKDLMLPRYKIVVQVAIGEQRGQGVRMGSRCFWDADTDSYASETYSNESLFCVATAYGVYLY